MFPNLNKCDANMMQLSFIINSRFRREHFQRIRVLLNEVQNFCPPKYIYTVTDRAEISFSLLT